MENRGYLIVIAEPERRLWQIGKDIGAKNDLLNDFGFNLYIAPQSLVMRLVVYFGVVEVIKTEVLTCNFPLINVREVHESRSSHAAI